MKNLKLVQLDAKELQELTREVKETVAVLPKKTRRSFTAAQLWNCQRQVRLATLSIRK